VEGRGKDRGFNPPLNLEVVDFLDWRFDPPLNLEGLSSLGSHYFP